MNYPNVALRLENSLPSIELHSDVDFVRVTESGRRSTPDAWKSITNLRQISFRDFVLEADL